MAPFRKRACSKSYATLASPMVPSIHGSKTWTLSLEKTLWRPSFWTERRQYLETSTDLCTTGAREHRLAWTRELCCNWWLSSMATGSPAGRSNSIT
ncbi:hypothetical protein GBAR_LOCUS24547 [Geodia barretti]|uniref:Uncharacterized protein n=1 Tax=Geodia barretti TaxID=519541 RepID=A0AA35TA39_GEOBA|nr:hypothetical protein GBAR_LOCUS24547 [Geodia barretti]